MRRLKILKIYFVFWLFIFFLVFANFKMFITFFMSTLTFNIAVLTTLAIGMVIVYHAAFRLTMLAGTFGILAYKKGDQLIYYLQGIDRIMPASIAHMFYKRAKSGTLYFTQSEAKDVTNWLEEKFANQKVYVNFFTATALMIGLFGTFTGLLKSIDEMGGIILSLSGDINLAEVISGFAGPLSGMAIGFGSSLFGVATAIILSVKTYILSRNQEAFIEDIEDWMKGKIIDTQSSEVIEQFQQTMGTSSVGSSGQAQVVSGDIMSSGKFLNVFADAMGGLKDELRKSAEGNEVVYKMLSENFDATNKSTGNEIALLESIVNSIKELNINQFSNSNTLDESIQSLANIATSQTKTMKQLLDVQKQNQETMEKFVEKFDARLNALETKLRK
jgi:biopolymer transport protein ExbB/TolQ